jgi:hypothetical protein
MTSVLFGQRLHGVAHDIEPDEEQAEAEDDLADMLDLLIGDEKQENEADEGDGKRKFTDFDGHEPGGDGGADVGTHDDTDGLAERHEAGRYKADDHDGGGAAALEHRGDQRADQDADERIDGEDLQDAPHFFTGGLLQALPHEVHAKDEDGESAEQGGNSLNQNVLEHLVLRWASLR